MKETKSSILRHLDWLIDFYIIEDLGFKRDNAIAFKSYLNKYKENA